MKITINQLRRIIKEEVKRVTEAPRRTRPMSDPKTKLSPFAKELKAAHLKAHPGWKPSDVYLFSDQSIEDWWNDLAAASANEDMSEYTFVDPDQPIHKSDTGPYSNAVSPQKMPAMGGKAKFKKLSRAYMAELDPDELSDVSSMLGKSISQCSYISSEDPGFDDAMSNFESEGSDSDYITAGTYMGKPAVLVQNPQMDTIWM